MRWFKQYIPHPIQRSQSGQALIILALGFIGLLGFVGLVTDVSIMLVRHNQLVRAVDSAALNAANQMRSDRSFAEVGVAARMMIEMHGFESEEILVETCASMGGVDDYLCSEQNRFRKLVRVGATVMSPTVFLQLLGIEDFELSAISTSETAVLDVVMMLDVSESMLLDTTYADWAKINLGKVYVPPVFQNPTNAQAILNQESAAGTFISRGSSMLFPNPHNDPFDPVINGDHVPDIIQLWAADLLGDIGNFNRVWPDQVNERLWYPDDGDASEAGQSTQFYEVESFPYPGPEAVGTQLSPRDACRVRFWPYSLRRPINEAIRNSVVTTTYSGLWDGDDLTDPNTEWGGFIPTYDFYGCCNDPSNGGSFFYTDDGTGSTAGTWVAPTDLLKPYDGNNKFDDLICQPFKQARDATRAFLSTLDFDRGDRVALVTFDRGAFLIDPDGSQGAADPVAFNTCVRDPAPVNGRTALTHMMASFCRASITLMAHVGVRSEPNFYDWNEVGGGWRTFADGLTPEGDSDPVDYYGDGSGNPSSVDYVLEDRAFNQYPVNNNCPMFDAAIEGYYSRYSLSKWDVGDDDYQNTIRLGMPGLARIMTPPLANGLTIDNGYDLRASCRGGNVGAGLREANNALLDPATTRRSGTVWVIVMLGDGGSGASDPVRANGRELREADPFYDRGIDPAAWASWNGVDNSIRYGRDSGEYGAFGLCPIGNSIEKGISNIGEGGRPELLDTNERPPRFPYCSDEQPETRHFCEPSGGDNRSVGIQCSGQGASQLGKGFAPGSKDANTIPGTGYVCFADTGTPSDALAGESEGDYNVRRGNIYDVDIGNIGASSHIGDGTTGPGTCSAMYDTDDYAHDWADYVGLSETGAGDEQLPTIFTIGFGLDFANGRIGDILSTTQNPDEFLGEELLRYIADVGDNFQIDTDYQQDYREDQIIDGTITGPEGFGLRGPCEVQTADSALYASSADILGEMFEPLPPTQDCGNYYNAPDQARLQLVFDDIASRMFTRLAP